MSYEVDYSVLCVFTGNKPSVWNQSINHITCYAVLVRLRSPFSSSSSLRMKVKQWPESVSSVFTGNKPSVWNCLSSISNHITCCPSFVQLWSPKKLLLATAALSIMTLERRSQPANFLPLWWRRMSVIALLFNTAHAYETSRRAYSCLIQCKQSPSQSLRGSMQSPHPAPRPKHTNTHKQISCSPVLYWLLPLCIPQLAFESVRQSPLYSCSSFQDKCDYQ